MKKAKWQLIKNNNSNVKTYKLKIDRIQSFLIDEVNGSYSLFHHHTVRRSREGNAFFSSVKIANYKSLESAKRGVKTYIRHIVKAWNECNED